MITPHRIAYGIASSDRETLATLLSVFEESSLPTLLFDSGKDLLSTISDFFTVQDEQHRKNNKKSFEERIQSKRESILKEKVSVANLQLRLWMQLRNAFGLSPDITFSNTGVESIAEPFEERVVELASKMNDSEELSKLSLFSSEYWKKRKENIISVFAQEKVIRLSLSDIVNQNVFRLLVESEKTDSIPADVRAKIVKEVKQKISSADADLQKTFLKGGKIEDLTEQAAFKLLAGSGSLAGIGIAVELAGFSAYILAAEASAIIPFVGGQTLVSTLAVLANPLFIIPVILGGGIFLSGSVKRQILGSFGISAVTVLILKAIADRKQDANELVEVFKMMPCYIPGNVVNEYKEYRDKEAKNEMSDMLYRVFENTQAFLKDQFVTDSYPDINGYLDRYYELQGKNI